MGKRGKLQTSLEYRAVRGVFGGLGILPRALAVRAGRALGRAAYSIGGELCRTGKINLELAFPEKSPEERNWILRRSFESLGRLLGEFSQFPRHTPESLRKILEYRDIEHLRAAQARGRGVILAGLHLGAWELFPFVHSALYEPISVMVRRTDNPLVEEFVDRMRTRTGSRTIDKRNSARTILRSLRAGETLAILADLNSQPREGVFVSFFGVPACATASVALLALRTGAIVVPTCVPWDEERKKHVLRTMSPIEVTRTGNTEEDVRANTQRIAAALEQLVREYPDQWLWIHKRWHTRPAGESGFYPSRP